MKILAAMMIGFASALGPLGKRHTHDFAANAKSEEKPADQSEALKTAEARVVELEGLLEASNNELESLKAFTADLKDDYEEAQAFIKSRLGALSDEAETKEPLTVDGWARQQLEIFKAATVDHSKLDPEVRAKVQAGLTIEQAVEAISNQRKHDAALEENQTANPA